MRSIFALTVLAVLLAGCQNQKSKNDKSGSHEVVVQEVLQAGAEYTYLRVKEDDKETWLAVPAMDAKVGETYYYAGGLPLTNFESKELKRTFETILFLNGVSKFPIAGAGATDQAAQGGAPHMAAPMAEKEDVKVEPAKDGITIAKLFSDKKSYDGKTVIIKGQVVKFNPAIMNKNWIHIQDGTESDGKYDLTVTSDIEAEVGEIVTLEGKIALDKDFGMGYAYDVIMEDAVKK